MKNIVITAVITLVLSLGVQTFAFTPTLSNFTPNVEGRRTTAYGNDRVMIGSTLYEVKANPVTAEEKALKAWNIQAQILELLRLKSGLEAMEGNCTK